MSDWLPSLNALRAFETVARHLNYRLAAAELHVTPAAVKQLVAKLEDSLAVSLLEKKGRGLELTNEGKLISSDLSRSFTQISESVQRLRKQTARKRLIISVEPSFAAAWLIPRLDEFRAENTDVDVLVDSSMRIVDLEHDAADIAIRFGVPTNKNYYTIRLFDESLAALCNPSIAKGLEQIEDIEKVTLIRWDLSEFEWAINTQQWNHWRYWLYEVGAEHIEPSEGLRINDYNLAVQAALAGQGMIIGSLPVLRSLIDQKLLCNPFKEVAHTNIGYDLVTLDSSLSNPYVKKFINWISNKVTRN